MGSRWRSPPREDTSSACAAVDAIPKKAVRAGCAAVLARTHGGTVIVEERGSGLGRIELIVVFDAMRLVAPWSLLLDVLEYSLFSQRHSYTCMGHRHRHCVSALINF